MAWRMLPETSALDRVWLAFPVAADEATYAAWAATAHAAARFVPVTVVVDPAEAARAARLLGSDVERVEAPLNDAWMRDIGPTFVVDDTRPGVLGAVDWVFNGWGGQHWARWDKDQHIARTVAGLAGTEVVASRLVNEGGGIHTDGEGTVLATETVQLDPGRNPAATKADVEAEFARTLGATKVIWLPRGLTRDYDDLGTRGHVDIVAALPSPGTLLLHRQDNPGHPDFHVTRQLRALLAGQTDARGRAFEIVDLPAPDVTTDAVGFVDYSYVNHLVANGGVVACGFGEPVADARAAEILAHVYPGRDVVTVDARPIFAQGGGIHCITQQQPRPPA